MKLNLPAFGDSKVLVAGDVLLDRYWHGETARVSPEAPVPVVRVIEEETRAGGAGNVALNIRQLGGRVSLFGLAGEDDSGNNLSALLRAGGVDAELIKTRHATITKLRVISRHQQLIRLDFENGVDSDAAETLAQHFKRRLKGVQVAVLSDYGKGALPDPQALIEAARNADVPVLVDPKGRDFSRYRGADLLTPNLAEFEAVAGACDSPAVLTERAHAMIEQLQLKALLLTRGDQGMSLIRLDEEPIHMPTRAREVFDVTGAGDTVIGVLACALAAGADLVQAAGIANLAAGIVVGKLGTAGVTPHELRRALHESEETGYGMLDSDDLLQAVHDARAHGERIVFTNGCFDIIHAGHVAYLNDIRALGDRLIVAVNDDDSVRRLKGDTRPIHSLEDRMAVLAGLSAVDWVVPFSEDTPVELIDKIKPDVLAKGGDYRPEEIAGFASVTERGGEVVVVEHREGRSTSSTIERIKNRISS